MKISVLCFLLVGLAGVCACSKDPKAAQKEAELARIAARAAEMEADIAKYDKRIQDAGADHGLVIKLKAEQDLLRSRIVRLKSHLPQEMRDAPKAGGH